MNNTRLILCVSAMVAAAFLPSARAQNPFLDAKENTPDDLCKAIVVYPYSWEHGKIDQPIDFEADGTAGKGKLNWRARGAQEIELWHVGAPDKKIVLKFSKDYTSYTGVDFQSNPLTGHQMISKPKDAKPQPPQQAGNGGGSDDFGSKNQGAAGAQAASAPLSPEMRQKASDIVKEYHNSLVFVTGGNASGSGFIAALGGSNLLFPNAHVAAGINDATFKTLDDTAVQGGAASVAVGRDVFCMAMPAGGKPLEVMQDVEANAAIDDDVAVLGNAGGEGVINTITGKITGIGPGLVEVDAPFVPGNSGSPIIHLKSGKVIGVATYLVINNYDTTTNEKNAKPVIRRFGYRIDNVKSWQAVNWQTFRAQAAEMGKIETLTADLYDLFRDMQENKGSITPGRHTNPVIKGRIDQWFEDRTSTRSAADENAANANFFSFLKVACQSDVAAAKQHMTYDYFQRDLASEQQDRDEMSKAFEEIVKNLRE
jgi:hypothetical protein